MKKIVKIISGVALIGSLNAFGADFSKKTNAQLVELAGKVAPKDYPDFKMEVHSRIQEMKVKDADIFREQLRDAKRLAHEKNTPKQNREYREAVQLEIDKRLEKMSIEEARNKGLLPKKPKGAYGAKRPLDCPQGDCPAPRGRI